MAGDSHRGTLPVSARRLQGEPSTSRLATLVEEIRQVMEDDVGGSDAWARRLNRVSLDIRSPRRKRIGGERAAAFRCCVEARLILQSSVTNWQCPMHWSRRCFRIQSASRRLHGTLSYRVVDQHQVQRSKSRELGSRFPGQTTGRLHLSRYDLETRISPGHLQLSSSWLQSSGCDIVELQSTDISSIVDDALSVDALAIVIDPYRLWTGEYLERLQPALVSGRPLVVIVNGRLPETTKPKDIEASVRESLQASGLETSSVAIHLVDASLASKALDALSDGLQRAETSPSTRSRAFETFQHAYLQSHIGSLQTTLAGLLPSDYQSRTALSAASFAITSATTTIASDLQALQSARNTVNRLRDMSTHSIGHVVNTSVINRGIDGGMIEGGVDDEISRAQQEIDQLFKGRFSWIGLIGRLRIDDIGGEMASYITQRFGQRLERQVRIHSAPETCSR